MEHQTHLLIHKRSKSHFVFCYLINVSGFVTNESKHLVLWIFNNMHINQIHYYCNEN